VKKGIDLPKNRGRGVKKVPNHKKARSGGTDREQQGKKSQEEPTYSRTRGPGAEKKNSTLAEPQIGKGSDFCPKKRRGPCLPKSKKKAGQGEAVLIWKKGGVSSTGRKGREKRTGAELETSGE